MKARMKSSVLVFGSVAALVCVSGCVAPGYSGQRGSFVTGGVRASSQQTVGVDFCEDRLPPAQARIEELYERVQGSSRRDEMSAEITDPMGNAISVSVSSDSSGAIVLDSVHTGLSDVIIDCGETFSDKECFIDVFIDGEEMVSLSPVTKGRVPMRCLAAGRRSVRVVSTTTTLFDGVLDLESDHEYLISLEPEYKGGDPTLQIHTVNYLADRVPPVPTTQNTAVAGGDTAGAVAVSGNGISAAATLATGDAQAPSVDASSSTRSRTTSSDYERRSSDDWRGRDEYERDTRATDTRSSKSRVRIGEPSRGSTSDVPRDVPRDEDAGPEPMSRSDFAKLIKQVEDEMGSSQLDIVRSAAKYNYFTSVQVRALVAELTMSSRREDAAVMLHSRVVDPGNYHIVLDAFSFDSTKRKVIKRLGL